MFTKWPEDVPEKLEICYIRCLVSWFIQSIKAKKREKSKKKKKEKNEVRKKKSAEPLQ